MFWILHFNDTPRVQPTSNFFAFGFNELIGSHYTKWNAGLKTQDSTTTNNELGQTTQQQLLFYSGLHYMVVNS